MPNFPARLARAVIVAAALAGAVPAVAATNLSGAYLAAMQADFRNDYAAAADYYSRALKVDGNNAGLLQNSVVMYTALGEVGTAVKFADILSEAQPENQLARLVRLADAIAQGEYDAAAELIADGGNSLNRLLSGLLSGWVEAGRSDFDAAQEQFDAMNGSEAIKVYGQYHKALLLAHAGDFVSAERIMAGDGRGPLHLNRGSLIAHAQILAQLDRNADAIALLNGALSGGVPDAALISLRDRLAGGEEIAFTAVSEVRRGAAEAFLTLAEAVDSQESGRVGLLHARLAVHLDPEFSEAQVLAAEMLEAQNQYALANQVLAEVPESSPWFVVSGIRRANTQRAGGDPDGGIETLVALSETNPDKIEVHSALGDALRSAELYSDAADAYSDAINLIDDPKQAHWTIYYTRGISHERSDNWEAAESDFRKALELQPDHPLVLNYLGYSLVEEGRNLDEALAMIERAVERQPDDGYITDSLGWVLYRLNRTEEAVPHMLKAVELTPDDPIINDHLGDVLWAAGRKREAEFQWRRALSFGPADDLDMDRVRLKLEIGLDRVLEEHPEADQDG